MAGDTRNNPLRRRGFFSMKTGKKNIQNLTMRVSSQLWQAQIASRNR
jgi:hypothetical protein